MRLLLWERWEGRWESEVRGAQVYLVRNKRSLHVSSGCDVLGAFYSEKLPGPTGRIVVLNTNLYYSQNKQTASMADPGQQFQWLEDVLTNASRAGEMVRAPASSPFSLGSLPEQVFHLSTNSSTLSRCPHQRVLHQLDMKRGLLPSSEHPVSLDPETYCRYEAPEGW